MKIYTLYLSTQATSGAAAPSDKSVLADVKWQVNWQSIFNGDQGKLARVKFHLASLSQSGVLTWGANLGTLRALGISNTWSNSSNGLILGEVAPLDNPVAGNPNHIMYGDTLQSAGVQCTIPRGMGQFELLFLDDAEVLMTNLVDYQVILQFEVDE